MNIMILTDFFFWCSLINGAILVLLASLFSFMPHYLYKSQYIFFKIDKKSFDIMFYYILAFMKFTYLTFNLVPYIALLIIQMEI